MANNFDVMKRMAERNSSGIALAPLSNVIRSQETKAGTRITIGAPSGYTTGILMGKYVGGLLLIDKAEFDAVAREIDAEGRND